MAIFGFSLFVTSDLKSYDGGFFWFDWWEHYIRSLMNKGALPISTEINAGDMTYLYNSRPPLANIMVSLLMVDNSFRSFQLSSLIVNSLQFLSLFWLASEWFKYKGKKIENIHYLLIVLSPFLIWNTIYPWTRGFTNALCFLVLLVS